MNKLKPILLAKNLHPLAFVKKGKVVIIEDKSQKVVLKLKTNNSDIYKYLLSRKFNAFPRVLSDIEDDFEITEFIPDLSIKPEQKVNDLLLLLAELHQKTSYSKAVEMDEINYLYHDLKKKLLTARDYYYQLNDKIDKETFLSPGMYLLVRNIFILYSLIEYAIKNLDEWQKIIMEKKQMRYSLIYNNVLIDHLLVNRQKYLISWDQASFGMPIDDIKAFYHQYFSYLELEECLKQYQTINFLTEEEQKLLLVNLSIPPIMSLEGNNLDIIKKIKKEIDYMKKIFHYYKNNDDLLKSEKIS